MPDTGTSSVDDARWREAQQAELGFWSGVPATQVISSIGEQVNAAAWVSERLPAESRGDWVEIGIGPLGVGVCHFLDPRPAHITGLDPLPLLDLTGRLAAPLTALLDTSRAGYTHHVTRGEDSGLPAGGFDGGVCYNVLDHVQDCGAVLDELRRLVRPGGPAFIACDTRSYVGAAKYSAYTSRRQAGTILVDAHPHQFTAAALTRLVEAHGFAIREVSRLSAYARLAGHARRVLILAERT